MVFAILEGAVVPVAALALHNFGARAMIEAMAPLPIIAVTRSPLRLAMAMHIMLPELAVVLETLTNTAKTQMHPYQLSCHP